jgi:RNA polymerase sigma factor (sigma-70 family)
MTQPLPRQLSTLLDASHAAARNGAWDAFLSEYSTLLLNTARRASSSHDDAMDHYTFILEELQGNNLRRLRGFAAEGRGKFTTWLVVVARRLCVDHHRRKYGRPQGGEPSGADAVDRVARRNLSDLIAGELDIVDLEDEKSLSPDAAFLHTEQRRALQAAVSRLDAEDRLLLTLRFEDGNSAEKIAPMIGLRTRFQALRRLNAVLSQLRQALEQQGITKP